MSAEIPTRIPASIRAGETLQFKLTFDDYPASDGWTVRFSFRANQGTAIDFTSAASGDDHLVTVAFGETTDWLPGRYAGVGIVSDNTTAKSIWSGSLIVLPNLSVEGGFDTRSQARRTLDNINAVIEGRANSSILKSAIEGTVIDRIPVEQLLMLKDRYEIIVRNEEMAERASQGLATGRNIFTRFTRPR